MQQREEINEGNERILKKTLGQKACFISYMECECDSLEKGYFHSHSHIFLAHNLEANTTK